MRVELGFGGGGGEGGFGPGRRGRAACVTRRFGGNGGGGDVEVGLRTEKSVVLGHLDLGRWFENREVGWPMVLGHLELGQVLKELLELGLFSFSFIFFSSENLHHFLGPVGVGTNARI